MTSKTKENKTNVIVKPYGPIIIEGDLHITFSNGEEKNLTRVVLCRCNESKKMPFCDGSHKQIGYHSD